MTDNLRDRIAAVLIEAAEFRGVYLKGECMTDDLRTRIAAVTVGHADYVSGLTRYCTCGQWSGDSTGTRIDFSRHLADVLIRELPELQPCPFCGLSHNKCGCLRTISEEPLQISERGMSVIESGLTLRQAHEIKTGCSQDDLCAECKKGMETI